MTTDLLCNKCIRNILITSFLHGPFLPLSQADFRPHSYQRPMHNPAMRQHIVAHYTWLITVVHYFGDLFLAGIG